ncbi:MAG: DUF167 domain-containing protein [Patescibacteria group bacterium]|jgi:hypothetical protein
MENILSIHLHPNAKQNKIETQTNGSFEIWVTAQPQDNKANAACLKVLAKQLKVSPSRLEIIRGFTSRHKTIKKLK